MALTAAPPLWKWGHGHFFSFIEDLPPLEQRHHIEASSSRGGNGRFRGSLVMTNVRPSAMVAHTQGQGSTHRLSSSFRTLVVVPCSSLTTQLTGQHFLDIEGGYKAVSLPPFPHSHPLTRQRSGSDFPPLRVLFLLDRNREKKKRHLLAPISSCYAVRATDALLTSHLKTQHYQHLDSATACGQCRFHRL